MMKIKMKNRWVMLFVAIVNLTAGLWIMRDSWFKINSGRELFYFDDYLGAFGKSLPFLLGLSMIIASILIIKNNYNKYLLHTYINSFIYILFFTPSLFYKDLKDKIVPFVVLSQVVTLLLTVILLFSKPDRKTSLKNQDVRTKMTYEEYKEQLNKLKNLQEGKSEDDDENEEASLLNTFFEKIKSYFTKRKELKKEASIMENDLDEKVTETTEKKPEQLLLENKDMTKEEQVKITDELLGERIANEQKKSQEVEKEKISHQEQMPEINMINVSNEQASTTKNETVVEEIKLPKENKNKTLMVQDNQVSLSDDDVKVVDNLKDMVNSTIVQE